MAVSEIDNECYTSLSPSLGYASLGNAVCDELSDVTSLRSDHPDEDAVLLKSFQFLCR